MTQTNDIRRRADGSIDLAFYRAGATALRRQTMRDAATLRKAFVGILAMAGVLGLITVLAWTPRPSMNLVASAPAAEAQTHADPI